MKYIVIIWLSTLPFLSIGQKSWDLKRCITYGLKHNANIQIASLEMRKREADYKMSREARLPDLYGYADMRSDYGRSIDGKTNQLSNTHNYSSNGSISTSIVLFEGFSRTNEIAYNRYNVLQGYDEKRHIENQTVSTIIKAYYQVLMASQMKVMAQKQKGISSKLHADMQQFVKVGRESKVKEQKLYAQYLSDQSKYVKAATQEQIARNQLHQILSLDQSITVDDETSKNRLFTLDSIVSPSSNLADLSSCMHQIEMDKKYLKMVKGKKFPTLTFGAYYATNYYYSNKEGVKNDPFIEQINNNQSQQLYLKLSIPIYDKGRRRRNVKRAKIQLSMDQTLYKEKERVTRQIINDTWEQLKSDRERYNAAQALYKHSILELERVQKEMKVGMVNPQDVALVKQQFAESWVDMMQAKYQVDIQQILLKYYQTGDWSFIIK
ncbi:TolC family protein [Halosquirtibacter laminarini]|uniref:TolC family protein n=1 Tax=Halosquirtibacter laminarini TaxID=3374600 RepID=A0AC61NJG9_9BACT|nr:TolC family protein [Prolixibacteraceae bacterium]